MERAMFPVINGIPMRLDNGIEIMYSNKLIIIDATSAFL
jgi:hypothetical protein